MLGIESLAFMRESKPLGNETSFFNYIMFISLITPIHFLANVPY